MEERGDLLFLGNTILRLNMVTDLDRGMDLNRGMAMGMGTIKVMQGPSEEKGERGEEAESEVLY